MLHYNTGFTVCLQVNFIFDDNNLPSVFLYTDSKRLHQVLSNLIDNAVKFTNQGSIRFGYEIQSEENTDKQFVHIYVEDTGIGVSHRQTPYINTQ